MAPESAEARLRLAGFREHRFAGGSIWEGRIPRELAGWGRLELDDLWQCKPGERHEITMPDGRRTRVRRFQQAFDHDYAYTGTVNRAQPMPTIFGPIRGWLRDAVSPSANGLLVNWYRTDHVHHDARRGDYISQHHDTNRGQLADGSLIACVSLGDPRRVRFSKTGTASLDLGCDHGHVYAFDVEANERFKHGIPHPNKSEHGRPISITARTFR